MDIRGFSKTYQKRTVLRFPDFSFEEGKIYAVIGANGSGKSTFAKIIAGTLTPDTKDESEGRMASPNPTIGYLPQKPYAFNLTLIRNLMINAPADKKAAALTAEYLMGRLSLSALADKKAVSLSGGETARMCLARLLMKDYSVLILDEPCAAMDISSTLESEKLIKEYCIRTNSVIILITHSLQQAIRISDEVLFFSDGSLVEYGPSREVLRSPSDKKTIEYLNFYYSML